MADVIFEDFTIKVCNLIESNIDIALEESAGELESQIKRNTRRDTGQTANSFTHKVINQGDIREAIIGSPEENSIWEEFGTGEYALEGNGRKGGWSYKDEKGEWHYTIGKPPSRAMFKAYTSKKKVVIRRLQDSLKGI